MEYDSKAIESSKTNADRKIRSDPDRNRKHVREMQVYPNKTFPVRLTCQKNLQDSAGTFVHSRHASSILRNVMQSSNMSAALANAPSIMSDRPMHRNVGGMVSVVANGVDR